MQLKIAYVDSGFCRVVYKGKNSKDETVYYCLQYDGKNEGVNMYRCTNDARYHEPSYTVTPKKITVFEEPTGNSDIEVRAREYIKNHKLKCESGTI